MKILAGQIIMNAESWFTWLVNAYSLLLLHITAFFICMTYLTGNVWKCVTLVREEGSSTMCQWRTLKCCRPLHPNKKDTVYVHTTDDKCPQWNRVLICYLIINWGFKTVWTETGVTLQSQSCLQNIKRRNIPKKIYLVFDPSQTSIKLDRKMMLYIQ